MNNLQGKIAWITGAGSGIGEATAKALACKGASVVLTGRRVEPLERVAEEIRKTGGQADVLSGDVTDKRRVQEIADSIVTKRGRIDILVNNAGMNVSGRSWRDLSPDCAQEVIAGNLSSAFYVVTSVLPAMRAQRDGLLIHISSWAGRYISPVAGPSYTAAKHGVVAMSHSLNMEEFSNGIRSTVICPGEVSTPILDQRPVPVSAEYRARILQSEDLANTVVFVASQPTRVCVQEIVIIPRS